MDFELKIVQAVEAIVEELYGQQVPEKMVQLQQTRSEFEGQVTLVVFPFTKMSHKAPEVTGQEIGERLQEKLPEVVSGFNVVKGFLNISIASAQWISILQEIYENPNYGFTPVTDDSPLVMIEYSSPNTNKPLHLGHVRNNLLGWALAQVMQANGNKVVKTNIVNDRGIHICKSMLAWLKWGNGETPESSGKKGDHLIGDYYVAFDKHYRQEVAELVAKGMDKEQAKQEAPLIREAHEMLLKVYRKVFSETAPENITLMGDSAGGAIALSLSMLARDRGLPMPKELVLISPGFAYSDLSDEEIERFKEISSNDFIIGKFPIMKIAILWCGDLDKDDYRVEVTKGNLDGLPRITFFSGTKDILNIFARKFVGQLEAAGHPYHYEERIGGIHDYALSKKYPAEFELIASRVVQD